MREVAQVSERSADGSLRRTIGVGLPVRRIAGGELQEQLKPDEPLLGAVMQVTFQAPPLGVRVLDDAPPGGGQISQFGPQPGLSSDVLKREARTPDGGAEQLSGTRQLSPVPNLRDRPA